MALLALIPTTAFAENFLDAAPSPSPSPSPSPIPSPSPAPSLEIAAPEAAPELPRAFTGIRGRVTDAKTGEALIEATVKIVRGPVVKSAQTDVDGNYALKVPPGVYQLRIFYELYKGRQIGSVLVEKGKPTTLDVGLGGDETAVQEVVVETKADKRSAEALLAERKKSAVVSDAISAQEIARSPDTRASDAVKRLPSATVRDDRYVFIRGLGGRYSQTLLNRSELPSPEPDEPQVPLDIFPTVMISNLNVIKTYSAELPGNFSGGALLIETNSYPSKFEVRTKLTLEYNSEASFRRMNTYNGGSTDFLGFDDGNRALPAAVPKNGPVPRNPPETVERIGESFTNVWSARRRIGIPGLGLAASVGGTKELRANSKLGYLVGLNYSYRDRVRRETLAKGVVNGPGSVRSEEEATSEIGIQSAQLGLLANLGLKAGAHELNLFTFYTHSADNEAQTLGTLDAEALGNQDANATRLRFIERGLSYTQLRGDHTFARAHNLELNWQSNFSFAHRDEPDTRDTTYDTDRQTGTRRFRDEPQSGERLNTALREYSGGGGIHLMVPWRRFKLRFGAVAQSSHRRFDGRRFRFTGNMVDPSILGLGPEQLFAPEHINATEWSLIESTRPTDGYTGDLTVGGGYVSGELNAPERLRVIAGLRYEAARQVVAPGSIYAPGSVPASNRFDSDFLPSVNFVVALTPKMNLRAGYSYTLARPRFRELVLFPYFDFSRRRFHSGNPLLTTTHIHNADVRWELFPSDGGVLAVSAFYKYFVNPIETTIYQVTDGSITYRNADAAHLVGAEIEARTSLWFLSRKMKDFYLGANLAFIYSRVRLSGQAAAEVTNKERALWGQSPYVVNINAGWSSEKYGTEISLLYNVYGNRIAEVGSSGAPDVFEEPHHRLDLTAAQRIGRQVRLKLAAANLAYQSIVLTQGSVVLQKYNPGVNVALSLEWNPF